MISRHIIHRYIFTFAFAFSLNILKTQYPAFNIYLFRAQVIKSMNAIINPHWICIVSISFDSPACVCLYLYVYVLLYICSLCIVQPCIVCVCGNDNKLRAMTMLFLFFRHPHFRPHRCSHWNIPYIRCMMQHGFSVSWTDKFTGMFTKWTNKMNELIHTIDNYNCIKNSLF